MLNVWKELTVIAPADDVFRCVLGWRSINSLKLICVYSGQAVMDLLALISINSVVTLPKCAAVGKKKFIEVDKTWQRWRSALWAVAFCTP